MIAEKEVKEKKEEEKKLDMTGISEEDLKLLLSSKGEGRAERSMVISDTTMRASSEMHKSIIDTEKDMSVSLLEGKTGKAIAYTDGMGLKDTAIDTKPYGMEALINSMSVRRTKQISDRVIEKADLMPTSPYSSKNKEELKEELDFWKETEKCVSDQFNNFADSNISVVKCITMNKPTDLTLDMLETIYGIKEKKRQDVLAEQGGRFGGIRRALGLGI